MYRPKIKASGIANLTDARYFAAWDVEWMGFNLNAGIPPALSPIEFKAIKEWVEGPEMVGEFGFLPAEELVATATELELESIQVNQLFPAGDLEKLESFNVLQEWVVEQEQSMDTIAAAFGERQGRVAAFVLDLEKNDISWELIKEGGWIGVEGLTALCSQYPIYLGIKVASNELEEFFETVKPLGLSVIGGEEEKVGYKSYEDLDEIFEYLEED